MCSPEVLNIEGVLSEYSTLFLQMHMDPPATRANLAMDAFWLLTFVNLNPRQFHKRWNSNTSNAADVGAPFLPRPWNYLVAWRLNMLEHAAVTPKVEASAHFETWILEGLTYLCQPSQLFFPGNGFNFSSERVLKILKQTRPCFRGEPIDPRLDRAVPKVSAAALRWKRRSVAIRGGNPNDPTEAESVEGNGRGMQKPWVEASLLVVQKPCLGFRSPSGEVDWRGGDGYQRIVGKKWRGG